MIQTPNFHFDISCSVMLCRQFPPSRQNDELLDKVSPQLDERLQMRKFRIGFMCFLATLLVAFVAGCGQETVTLPSVVSTTPAQGSANVAVNATINATFSEAMSAASISTTTFKVAAPGGVAVAGTVALNSAGTIATFTPTAVLLNGDTYTATITTGAAAPGGAELIGPYVWTFLVGAPRNMTPPELVSTVPASGATGVCLNPAVSATFSEAMNSLNLNSATFLLYPGTSASGIPILGGYSYDATDFIDTFTPTNPLTATSFYTATVTSGATDLNGNPLGTTGPPNPWTFKTGSSTCQPLFVLGPTIKQFGGFGGSAGMTNVGISTVINNGNIGTTGASTTITGFHDTSLPIVGVVWPCTYIETGSNIGQVNGVIDTNTPPPTVTCPNEGTAATFAIATEALAEANTAYLALQSSTASVMPGSAPQGTTLAPTELGGETLYPGVYYSATTVDITSGNLTLDAQGDPTATWVFQVGSALTVGEAGFPRSIILAHGAKASNITWVCGSAATINGTGGGTFEGTVIAGAAITVGTNSASPITTINGRLIGLVAGTTLANTIINVQ
jgi:hypothetical protein